MIILRLLLLLTNLHLKLLSTQGTGAEKLLSTQRVNYNYVISSTALYFCTVCKMTSTVLVLGTCI